MSYNLKELIEITEIACRAAFDNKEKIDGAINWGDLHCVGSEKYEDSDGNTGNRVYIEEASPDSVQLWKFVSEYLEKAGFHDIDIIIEW